jgi:hypothetical protein
MNHSWETSDQASEKHLHSTVMDDWEWLIERTQYNTAAAAAAV